MSTTVIDPICPSVALTHDAAALDRLRPFWVLSRDLFAAESAAQALSLAKLHNPACRHLGMHDVLEVTHSDLATTVSVDGVLGAPVSALMRSVTTAGKIGSRLEGDAYVQVFVEDLEDEVLTWAMAEASYKALGVRLAVADGYPAELARKAVRRWLGDVVRVPASVRDTGWSLQA